MFSLFFYTAFAADPAALNTAPPAGADLERLETGGWRFIRAVEIEGMLVTEEGLAIDNRITHLRWSAAGRDGERLADWQQRRSQGEVCPSHTDRRIVLLSGVLFVRYPHTGPSGEIVIIEERPSPYTSCAEMPSALTGLVQKTSPASPPPPPAAPHRVWSGGALPHGSVVRDPPPEIASRLTVEVTDVPRVPVMRIVGGCLAEYPASGQFQWQSDSGAWRASIVGAEADASEAFLSCTEALLAPMLPRGSFAVDIAPETIAP